MFLSRGSDDIPLPEKRKASKDTCPEDEDQLTEVELFRLRRREFPEQSEAPEPRGFGLFQKKATQVWEVRAAGNGTGTENFLERMPYLVFVSAEWANRKVFTFPEPKMDEVREKMVFLGYNEQLYPSGQMYD